MELQSKQISKHVSGEGKNESGSVKGAVIPWEILTGLLLSTLQDCSSRSEVAMGLLQL